MLPFLALLILLLAMAGASSLRRRFAPPKPPSPYGKRLRADRRERTWRKRMRRLRGKPWLRAALQEWRRRHPWPR